MVAVGTASTHDPDFPEPTPTPNGGGAGKTLDFTPNYYEHIQPIMEANCISCHIPGEFGYDSFAMDTPDGIIASAEDIALVTTTGYMPPWPPGEQSPHFMYERTLTDEEIALLVASMEAGTPAGDPANAVSAEPIHSGVLLD
jgi:mono/diheme cytochrome c family protein